MKRALLFGGILVFVAGGFGGVETAGAQAPQAEVQRSQRFDGRWNGRTSQGMEFWLTIKNGLATDIELAWSAAGACIGERNLGDADTIFEDFKGFTFNMSWPDPAKAPAVKGNEILVENVQTRTTTEAPPIFRVAGAFDAEGALSGTIAIMTLDRSRTGAPCRTTTTAKFTARRSTRR